MNETEQHLTALAKECREIEERIYTDYFSGETWVDNDGKEHIDSPKIRMNKSVYEVVKLEVNGRANNNGDMVKSVFLCIYNEDKNYLNVVLPLEQFEQLFVKNSLF